MIYRRRLWSGWSSIFDHKQQWSSEDAEFSIVVRRLSTKWTAHCETLQVMDMEAITMLHLTDGFFLSVCVCTLFKCALHCVLDFFKDIFIVF